jgi:hypothetical protein
VLFLKDGTYYVDLFYYDGYYYYFDCEYTDLSARPYLYLRALTGQDGQPLKDATLYVLTDSLELTFKDVTRSFYSCDLRTVTTIPFVWLGFTTYLAE